MIYKGCGTGVHPSLDGGVEDWWDLILLWRAVVFRVQDKPKDLFPMIENQDADSTAQLVPEFTAGGKLFCPAGLI